MKFIKAANEWSEQEWDRDTVNMERAINVQVCNRVHLVLSSDVPKGFGTNWKLRDNL